jgi:nucleoside diphosphate kinase
LTALGIHLQVHRKEEVLIHYFFHFHGSFNGKLRDDLLNVEIFTTLFEAQMLIENWRKDYNQLRPHSALGYRPPAPEALLPGYGSTTLSVVQ